ncbi:unnamed protein product [Haemonchus placei]|uniref:C6 domain-containing protein n=1 Tax=Haemonchus placei TaxID=6290 RepID=A0A0N4VSW2_HAEPC|nr:unnamed protein product [Haemonchus placei]
METTTAKETCDDCMELNVHLYDEDPYEDGASVLNRYSRQGCKHVQFFCRSFQMDDFRPVRTVFNTNLSITELPLSVEVLCKNGQWWYEKVAVNSLSCIYEPPHPNSPCMQCGQDLYVKPGSNKVEGAVYVDFRADRCLSAQLYCQPTKPHHFVDIYHDNAPMGIHGTSLNRTFHCNYDSQWVEVNTASIIGNVSCVMEKGPPSSTHMMESTTEAGETIYTTDEGMSSVDTIETRTPTTSPWEEEWSTTSGYGGEEIVSTTVNGQITTSPAETTTEMTTDNGESITSGWTDASEVATLPTSLEPAEEITTTTVESVNTFTATETSTIDSISDIETTEEERTSTTKTMSTMTTRYEATTESDFVGISSTEIGTTEVPPLQPEGSTTEEVTTQLWESSTSEEVPANSQASTSRENTQGSTLVIESTSVETTQAISETETSEIIEDTTPAGELGSTAVTAESPRSSRGSTIVILPTYPIYQSSTGRTRMESSTATTVPSTSTAEPLTTESTEDLTTTDNLEETSMGPSSQTTPVTITQRNTFASTFNTSPDGGIPSSLPTTTMEQTTDYEFSTPGDFETSTSTISKRTTTILTTADTGYVEPSLGTTIMPTSTDSLTDMITPSTDFDTMTPTLATTSATHESRPSEGPLPTIITTEKTPDTTEPELFTETTVSALTTITQEPSQEATTTPTSADPSTDQFITSSESFTESVFTPRPAERPSTKPSSEIFTT